MPYEPPEIKFATSQENHLTMHQNDKRAAFVYEPWQVATLDDVGRIRLYAHAANITAHTTRGDIELALTLDQLDEIATLATALSQHLHKQLDLMK